MIDLDKLTPAPWKILGDLSLGFEHGWSTSQTDFDFIALARNAFDVMMRRGWSPSLIVNGERSGMWVIIGDCSIKIDAFNAKYAFDDPFTALVEADKWHKENVEKK